MVFMALRYKIKLLAQETLSASFLIFLDQNLLRRRID